MAISDTDATGDYGSNKNSQLTSINDLITIVASGMSIENSSTADAVDVDMAATVSSSAHLTESTQPETNGERYIPRSTLGNGGFGRVYEAWDNHLHRTVAIKVDRHGRIGNAQSFQRFVEEARAAAKLTHPNIVQVFDVGKDKDGIPFVVFEFIDGESLAERLKGPDGKSAPLPQAEAISIMATIADAVHVAHKAGLIHRDLKPANILLNRNGKPHVADFGLAVDEASQRYLKGVVAGSWYYMSPEQIRGEAQYLDGRTDIWSLGVILYELLVGRRPFTGLQLTDVQDEILNREPKPLRQIDDSIPTALEQICFRCLSKQTKDRYSSAAEVAKALRACQKNSMRSSTKTILAASAVVFLAIPLGYAAYQSPSKQIQGRQTVNATQPQAADAKQSSLVAGSKGEPAPRMQVPKPGKPFPLFRVKPQVLVFPSNDGSSRWNFSAEDQELEVTCIDRAMFKLGGTTASDYNFRINLFQTPWIGNFGIFLGGRSVDIEGHKYFRFQLVHLDSISNRGNRKFLLKRSRIHLEEQFRQATEFELESTVLPELSLHDQSLQIGIRNGRIAFADWNQTLVWKSTGPEIGLEQDDAIGEFGIYVNRATTMFRRAEFLLVKENADGH